MAINLDIDVGHEHPSRRVRLWKEALRESVFGLDCETDDDDFQGTINGRVLQQGLIARSLTSRQTLRRTPELIRQSADASVVLAIMADGECTIGHDGNEISLESGAFRLLDDSRPFEAHLTSDTIAAGLLRIPKSTLVRRVGPIDDIVFQSLSADEPLQRLTLNFATNLIGSLDQLDAEASSAIFDQLLDLLALTLTKAKQGSVDPSTHRAAMLLRVKAYIKTHLRDEELTIDRTARALGVSSRYVNILFASEQTSFGRYVLAQRLEGARREVVDARRAHRQITECAYSWGFANPSHFGRAFKERFGKTPREARMERLSQ